MEQNSNHFYVDPKWPGLIVVLLIIIALSLHHLAGRNSKATRNVDLLLAARTDEDIRLVFENYTRAARAGDDQAALMLGLMMLPERGAGRQCRATERSFYQAAMNGNPLAALLLGMLYSLNPAISPGREEIYAYWYRASRQKDGLIDEFATDLAYFIWWHPQDSMNRESFVTRVRALMAERGEAHPQHLICLWIGELLLVQCIA